MKVRGLVEENYFESISVNKKANCHSVCNLRQRTADENIFAYQSSVGKKISVELDDGRPIFFGEIVEVAAEKTFHGNYIEVKAVSFSLKVDEISETRIFQNPEKTFGEILNTSRLNVSNCTIKLDEKFSSKKCQEIILQNSETAFEFMNRIAAWQGQKLWIKDTLESNCEIKIAAANLETAEKISPEDELCIKVGKRGKNKFIELISQRYFELGHILNFESEKQNFLIVALECYQENGVDRVKYELAEFKGNAPGELCHFAPVKLVAKVVDVKDDKNFGRVKVQFEIEDKDKEKSWLPYQTPYTGMIFLPEVGDSAEIFYTCGTCYLTSILRNKSLDSDFGNNVENEKYLGNNRKQRIFFREKSLEIKSADTSIFLDDEKIILTVGKNKIVMDKDGISVKTGGKFITDATGDISVKTGGKFITDATSDISVKSGGKFVADSSGAAQIKGSSVELG